MSPRQKRKRKRKIKTRSPVIPAMRARRQNAGAHKGDKKDVSKKACRKKVDVDEE